MRTMKIRTASTSPVGFTDDTHRGPPPAEPTPLDTAIQRFLAQIDALRGAPRSTKGGSPSAIRVHDLEPVLLLMAELEGQ
jgi:hypothetical protein